MDVNKTTKLLIKIVDKETGQNKWIHFCYIPETLYELYRGQKQEEATNFNSTLSRWVKEDFNKELSVNTAEELEELKNLVKDYYKEKYPEVYLEQSTDRQGWLRVWISKKIREELGINGE